MKLKVYLRDGTVITKITTGDEKIRERLRADGLIRFETFETAKELLVINGGEFKFAEYSDENYELADNFRLEKAESVVDLLDRRIRVGLQWENILPKSGRFTLSKVDDVEILGKHGGVFVVDQINASLYDSLEINPVSITSSFKVREENLEYIANTSIADKLYDDIYTQLEENKNRFSTANVNKVLFGESSFKQWLDNDDWFWNLYVKLDIAMYTLKN